MKLVDILARELKVWPSNMSCLWIRSGNTIYGREGTHEYSLSGGWDVPEDRLTAVVYPAQWQAAVDALKAENCAHLWVGWSDTEACELCNKTRKVAVEWNGEGLPPVGTVCEFNDGAGGEWKKVEVMYVSQYTILVKFDGFPGEDVEGAYSPEEPTYFRQIRTPEQISEKERDQAIEDLYFTINWNEGRETRPIISSGRKADYAKAIDAGYRKFEIVEG